MIQQFNHQFSFEGPLEKNTFLTVIAGILLGFWDLGFLIDWFGAR